MNLYGDFDGTSLKIELCDIAGHLKEETKADLARLICMEEECLAAVLNMVTDPSMYGEIWPGYSFDREKMLRLREKLAPMLDEFAQATIANQRTLIEERDEKIAKLQDDNYWLRYPERKQVEA